jgi:hypothetical protein
MKKFRFRPFMKYTSDTPENLRKLNAIRSLYYAHQESGVPPEDFAVEFYHALGDILMGKGLRDLQLTYVEFRRDSE